ncbi:MAG: hypothetical protein SGJ11_15260 [Phycisphaerae bacterium]|nr:hypothetical protein [Phycisphaerae bacterium]
MLHGHAVLDLQWSAERGTIAVGDRAHTLGLSVKDAAGHEKGVVANWKLDGDTLTIESDPFGYLPLFVWQSGNRIIVGTSPIAVVAAGAPGEADSEAVGLWCRIGLCLGERTLFKHVRLAPRGTKLVWHRGDTRVEGAGMPVISSAIRTVEEGVSGYCDLFRQAMQRRAPIGSSFAMPLSGGRDSRMMLLDAITLGHRPQACLTLSDGPESDHPDAVIARMLAARVNVPLVNVSPRSKWIESETRKHVLGGLLVLEHTWMMPLWDTLRASYGCWYDGLGSGAITRGDLCKQSCLDKFRSGAWTDLTREFASYALGVTEEQLRGLATIAPWIDARHESAVALVEAEFKRYEGAANPLTAMTFVNWGGRAISLNPYMLCATHPAIHTPFMDADLVRFLLSYPIELALKDDLQTAAVRRMHPDFADMPFDKDLPKATKRKKPLSKAVASRLSTVLNQCTRGGSFRSVGAGAALRNDPRLVSVVTALALLERASTSAGANSLLAEYGFDSAADRASLARHRAD